MDLVCFSHLYWNFVYQRPQHPLTRFTSLYRVFYILGFSYNDMEDDIAQSDENVWIVIPDLKNNIHDLVDRNVIY